jgi:phosphohistidine phosphatase
MARQLWLLRHGEAEPHGSRPDAERRLTERGERQARAAGEALARLGIEFTEVITSPKVRARDTARLAAAAWGGEPEAYEPLAEGFDARDALSMDGASTELVVLMRPRELTQLAGLPAATL